MTEAKADSGETNRSQEALDREERNRQFFLRMDKKFQKRAAQAEATRLRYEKEKLEEENRRRQQLLADQTQRETIQRARRQDLEPRISLMSPGLLDVPRSAEELVWRIFLDYPDTNVLQMTRSIGSVRTEAELLAVEASLPKRGPERKLFCAMAALWFYHDYWKVGESWSLAKASRYARGCDPWLAVYLTELTKREAVESLGQRQACAMLTSRSAALCDVTDFELAKDLCEFVLSFGANDYRALRVRGKIHFHESEFEVGADCFAQAATLDQNSNLQGVKWALRSLGWDEHRRAVDALLSRDPVAFGWLQEDSH